MVEIEIDLNAIGNTDNAGATGGYSPIDWVIINPVASGVYLPD